MVSLLLLRHHPSPAMDGCDNHWEHRRSEQSAKTCRKSGFLRATPLAIRPNPASQLDLSAAYGGRTDAMEAPTQPPDREFRHRPESMPAATQKAHNSARTTL